MTKDLRVIISGGGTGGHIFPALSIADAIRKICPDAKILFVGAEGRMEMKRVPAAGYEINGLPICGFDRTHILKNVVTFYKIMKSRRMARNIIKTFRPDVAVGVGGYASGPTLSEAQDMHIPTLIQEQNSYAGVTNKLLSRKANKICVAYDGMERFFPQNKIIMTGNPIRQTLLSCEESKEEAIRKFHLDPRKKTILIIGGSLGARTMNEAVLNSIVLIRQSDAQFIWQVGSYYYESVKALLEKTGKPDNLVMLDFIPNMAEAYKVADLVISRSGAGSISELEALGKPAILVPSPNVAEDHQTKNTLALTSHEAALYIKDADAVRTLIPSAINTIKDEAKLIKLGKNIKSLAHTNADVVIAKEVIALAESYKGKNRSN